MKRFLTVLFLTITVGLFAQTLKTYNGSFDAGYLRGGIANYTYYENPETHEYVKHGLFKYSYNGTSEHKGYNETISGNFENGLKNGKWTYTVSMTDFGKDNPFLTGTVSLVANYKNGYAHGNWKEIRSYKIRKKAYNYYQGTFEWKPFEPLQNMTINVNFKDGKIVGSLNIKDDFSNYQAEGSFDDNSMCIGTWFIKDLGWNRNYEVIYKDCFLYEFITRDKTGNLLGTVEKHADNYEMLQKASVMSERERLDNGIVIDTVIDNTVVYGNMEYGISNYFKKLLNEEYFLYNFIGGDLTFKEGIKGGLTIRISKKEFQPLNKNQAFLDAEIAYNNNDFIGAAKFYKRIQVTTLSPTEELILHDKIAKTEQEIVQLIEQTSGRKKFFDKFFKEQYDILENNRYYFSGGKGSIYYQYFNFLKSEEERAYKSCQQYAEMDAYICSCDTIELINAKNQYEITMTEVKKQYELSKTLTILRKEIYDKNMSMDVLNELYATKILFTKYLVVYKDFISNDKDYADAQKNIDNFTSCNIFLDKVIYLYSLDIKKVEKQLKLKDAETVEQIKSKILQY
jgi:hypothetical protein